MKRARKYINLREKLAAALSMLLPQAHRDDLRERKVPAKTVIALFQQDHNILHALGGPDRWWNLTPMLIVPHRAKAKRDTKIVAKVRRLASGQTRGTGNKPWSHHKPGEAIKAYRFVTGRKIRSRGFDRTKTRGFDGKVRPRKQRSKANDVQERASRRTGRTG